MSTLINERLAVLETQVEQIIDEGHKRESTQDAILTELRELRSKLDLIDKEILKYKGFLGGIVFVFSCLGVFLAKWAMPLFNLVSKMKGNG